MPPSTDGAWFALYRHLLLNELQGEQTLFLGQAVPRAWLRDGQQVRVERAPTYFGPVNLHFSPRPDSTWRRIVTLAIASWTRRILTGCHRAVGGSWRTGGMPCRNTAPCSILTDGYARFTMPSGFSANSMVHASPFGKGGVRRDVQNWCFGGSNDRIRIIASPRVLRLDQLGMWLHLPGVLDGSSGQVIHDLNGGPVSEHALGAEDFRELDAHGKPRQQ